MQTMVRIVVATTLVLDGCGCAKTDWIDRTLVTVDVTGTWSGTMMAAGSGGAGGVRDVVFELAQKGLTVKGTMRVTPRGQAPDTLEGTVAGDVFRFKDPRATWEGELTISGEEMAAPPDTAFRAQYGGRPVPVLTKPFTPAHLLQMIDDVVARDV